MYDEIVDALLGAHPYLLKVDGLPLVSVRVCLKKNTINIFISQIMIVRYLLVPILKKIEINTLIYHLVQGDCYKKVYIVTAG